MADLAHDMLAMLRRLAWVRGYDDYPHGRAWHCPCCGCFSHNRANEHHADSGCELAGLIRRAEAAIGPTPDPPRWRPGAFGWESATCDAFTATVRPDHDPHFLAGWGGRWRAELRRRGDDRVAWEGRGYPDAAAAKGAAETAAREFSRTGPRVS